ncbi:hypothetical protein PCK2_000722 [Pneumocystis canis]|nr:hypothetical protein PCK2_000722 [Pneumocystis canis]
MGVAMYRSLSYRIAQAGLRYHRHLIASSKYQIRSVLNDHTSLDAHVGESKDDLELFHDEKRSSLPQITLSKTIEITKQIYCCLEELIHKECINSLLKRITIPLDLFKQIRDTIDEEGLMQKQKENEKMVADVIKKVMKTEEMFELEDFSNNTSSESKLKNNQDLKNKHTWVIRKNASLPLKKLHEELDALYDKKDKLEKSLKLLLGNAFFINIFSKQFKGTNNLILKTTSALNHIVNFKNKNTKENMLDIYDAKVVGANKSTKSIQIPV